MIQLCFENVARLYLQSEFINVNGRFGEPYIQVGTGREISELNWLYLTSKRDELIERDDHRNVRIVLVLYAGAAPIVVHSLEEAQQIASRVWVPRGSASEPTVPPANVTVTWTPFGLQVNQAPTHDVGS